MDGLQTLGGDRTWLSPKKTQKISTEKTNKYWWITKP